MVCLHMLSIERILTFALGTLIDDSHDEMKQCFADSLGTTKGLQWTMILISCRRGAAD